MKNTPVKNKMDEIENQIREIEKDVDMEYEQFTTPIQDLLLWLESIKSPTSSNVSYQTIKDKVQSLMEKERQEIQYAYTAGFYYSSSEYNGETLTWEILNEMTEENEFDQVAEEYYFKTYNK